jgi:polyisoprenoid-binding protein YceI
MGFAVQDKEYQSMKKIASVPVAALFGALVTGTTHAESIDYRVEPQHTFVTFEVVHFNTSTVRGRFNEVEGRITLDRTGRTGTADITIDMGSIDSGVADFDAHLKSADFFNVEKTPDARFKSERFNFDGDKLASVPGKLTLLGKSLPVTLNAVRFNCYHHPMLKSNVCGGDFETTLERSQWGMGWGLNMGIPDEVRILIQIEAVEE